ncbi:SusD/RagB family nutrient-binding outer membrane lipoprotein [Flavihumibacter sp. UBA7668]|uniref:SusD/RagB family nutrient-binding outer membrane lipoprotein n=1 Tax=Flavihumibacter sp. UBA7668 TaxID=1946542 RepID=UPI0025C1C5BD|nr:SusD/RagB family nutrient-binding outer membrane lipoprotein [Flavihumibacter sp. UBA7668]
MKNLKNISIGLLLAGTMVTTSCNKDKFVAANIAPTTLYEVNPQDQFLRGSISIANDFEYYYDVYRKLNYWLQYTTPSAGNGANFNLPSAQFNYRYGNFYGNVGVALMDAIEIIDKMPDEEKASHAQIKAVSEILLSYYVFYVSDINGSIPFSEAFQARYGGTITPKYDSQQEIFTQTDNLIKGAVASLKANSANQVALGNNDPFFNGNVTNWIKAGNALRLKIGMRLMKRDVAKLTAIANEVFADPDQMASISDSWMLKAGPSYANATGNWNPSGFLAGKPVVDFMNAKDDPRLRIFYRVNADQEYVGSWTSPDDSKIPANAALYQEDSSFSELQHRIFTPNHSYGTAGDGSAFFPVLTYAEYCFIRADLAARGIAGSDAEVWYKNGIMASIDLYNQQAKLAKIPDYVEVTASEKDAYYEEVGVKYDPAKATELIAVQAYLDFYRNPMEAWAWWKRTGFPNTTSVLAWSELKSNGATLPLPRRASLSPLPTTSLLFENQAAAFEQMGSDPEYGSGPGDAFGRVWWDKQ